MKNDPVRLIDPNGKVSILVWAVVAAAIESAWDTYCADTAATKGRTFGLSFYPAHCDFDKHGHCYAGCAFNRCKLGISPFLTATYSLLYETAEHHDSWGDCWAHIHADLVGIINSYSYQSCSSSCTPCP